ncbi:ribokinase [Shouchella patagoniensis]|uniref:ribokinase n=1 Tax=Shouchella patagoniensis TaxID=228576 RepID=UPI000994FA9D|nr:ribokinase [Shouchella patagoniensis]
MSKPKVTVIGSINMDMVTQTDVVPEQGETVMGTGFQTVFGGKGANQAVACARLGADVKMIGRVGDDAFGELLKGGLLAEGVSVDCVEPVTHCSSGVATILLSDRDNRIIVTPGANHRVDEAYVSSYEDVIASSDIVLVQLEIPLKTVVYTVDLCAKHQIPVILNPAPAQELPPETYEKSTYITPNESEQEQLFSKVSAALSEKLIVTQGANGVRWFENGQTEYVAGHQLVPVDTTGAGDTFNGALAVAIGNKQPLREAISFANAAAAVSVQSFGAQGGMPTTEEVWTFLANK